MAKVRVYELAKELKTENKILVEKLKAAGMEINNHMSTLDEKAVLKARDIFTGAVSEVIEEKRIKPTVIRRRKKTIKVEPKKPEATAEPEEVVQDQELESEKQVEPPPDEKKAAKPELVEVEKKIKKEVPGKKPTSIKETEKSSEEETEARAKPKKAKRKKADEPAKIIKRAEKGPLQKVVKDLKKPKQAAAKPASKTQPLEPGGLPEEEGKKGKTTRKKKEKKRTSDTDTAPTKKGAVRHRKLEVFERADLYDGRKVKRKKKDADAAKDSRKRSKQTEITVPKAIKRRIKVQEKVTVGELARAMGTKSADLIKKLMALDVRANINQSIDFETATLVADEFGYELELDQLELESIIQEVEDDPKDLTLRPPVVTIMGHVDHGKTSLLDYIRESNIIGGESGGITQHIGAYYVERDGRDIAFLDTPGHAAFTAMRARGAKVTDIIVLVVAADDGVMPQTKEAVNHARAADIPIIVGVNKIDQPDADIEKVRRELADLDLVPEDWGGTTIYANISAKTGEGVAELLELILLQAEMLELKANANKAARGTVIEAKLDKSKGSVATVLIQKGTLQQGNHFVCGDHFGKVRAMLNNRGKRLKSAGPSFPVEIYGISGVPMAGDEFIVVEDEKKAKQIMGYRQAKIKAQEITHRGVVSLDDFFEKIKEGEVKELNIVLKADVQGSIEAVTDSVMNLSTDLVKLNVIHSSTGAITETDVMLASASGAIIIGFNVRANLRVVEVAEKEKVDIRYYDIIYNVIKDIRLAMTGLLEPIFKENVIGRADIKEVFRVPKLGAVAGCYVTDGHIERNAKVRLLREEVIIYDGKLASLRRFKDDVKDIQAGYECGIGVENFQDFKEGDVFEIYQIEEIPAEL